ncbi:N(2)-fixation sustaining protein CowN [Rhodopseudomonas palustris]|uniref:N(2)-fixation sustaining protein CowN n=1 Tax=Rhodopseudomonas palustris (strain BisB18) TaxID=316056 RepID=COWN_RHOPB|nr:RecName: Full=N(2)-fixation sustaining protein CowN; AltName: Full=CO weal-nitrogenase [Rhodopseudomonas palustris BisB18]
MNVPFDRYVSFKNADWEGKSQRVMAKLQSHIDAADNPFWGYFAKKRTELNEKQGLDDLRVLHNYLPTLREILEESGDDETLAMLEDLEVTCM